MKVKRCMACGKTSVPFFGMYGACEENGGSHRAMDEVEQPDTVVAERLRAALDVVPSFDARKFWATASTEIKALLKL